MRWSNREQRQHNQRPKQAAKARARRQQAPAHIRKAADRCVAFGAISALAGLTNVADTPTFTGDAYTEIVQRLAGVFSAVAWLAAAVLFVAAALLRALADIHDTLNQPGGGTVPGQPTST